MREVIKRKPLFAMTVAAFALAYFFYFRLASKPPLWPALVDVMFSLPLLYYFMFRPSPRQLLTAWLTITTVGLLGCRLLNPAPDSQLEQYSLLLALEVGCELCLLVLLLRRCRKLLRCSANVDEVMASAFDNKLVLFVARIPYSMIESVSRCSDGIRRQRGILRYRQIGQLNVRIDLREGSCLPNLWGRRQAVSSIYLSLDQPDGFIDALRLRIARGDAAPPAHSC